MNNLRTIFESEYKGYNFIYENLILQVFRNVKDLRSIKDKIEDISESDKKQINNVKLFAQISKGAEISFFDVEIKESVNLPRSRVAIQNFVKKIINNQSCAVIFFHYADNNANNIWRVSFVYVGKTNKDSTNAKRYTYICGKNQHCRTITQRFITLSQKERIVDNDLIEAFAVQSLSEDFFAQYKVFYEDFVQYITGNRYLKKGGKFEKTKIHEPNPIFEKFVQLAKKENASQKETLNQVQGDRDEEIILLAQKYVRDYIKKLMGRLVFLQFLQKKGWLGVEEGKEWGSGDKSYLQKLFEKSDYQDDFLEKVLEPLFFNTLNKVRENDIATKELQLDKNKKIKIPYLNGGLFENDKLFDDIKITFPKQLFSNPDYADKERHNTDEFQKIETKKECGLLDFFAQYNFTIDETDPNDVEIGVDPEMLGKIFENLLEDNKDKGAFYTPKEIVQYMCQESLIAYLTSDLTNISNCEKQSEEAILFESNIRNFIKSPHNISSLSEEQNRHSKLVSESKISYPFTEDQETYILQKLKNVKICDPAVGSGAFPMGMLNLLYACRSALEKEDDICKIKKSIVKDNIYGVDIEKGAIDIARLRFWLSIIVDETEPIPLPNLDYKLMQGNSLIESFEGVDLSNITKKAKSELFDSEETLKELLDALDGFYTPKNDIAKEKIRELIKTKVIALMNTRLLAPRSIEKLENKNFKLHENSEFFLWHTWFNDVFNRSNDKDASGFDIVIGNPPYIKEYENRAAFEKIKAISPYYMGKMDLWYAFACHGIDLLNNSGHLCFIAQNNWTTSAGAKKLRNKVIEDSVIKQLVDFNTYMVFESASIQTAIMLFEKNKKYDNYNFDYRTLKANATKSDMIDLLEKKQTDFTTYLTPKIERKNYKDKLLTFSDNDDLFEKIAKDCEYLKDDDLAQGIVFPQDFLNKKNADIMKMNIGEGVFALSNSEKDSLNLSKKELELIKPYYTSEQVHRYYTNSKNDLWIIYTDSSFKKTSAIKPYPNIKNHLDKFKKVITSDNKPYGLHRAREEHFFKGEKIISLRKCVGRPSFSYSDFDCYVSATFYIIQTNRFNLKYLTGLLNSTLIAYWLKNKGKMQGANYQIDKEPLMQIPIKNATASEQSQIAVIVDKILTAKKTDINADTSELENQIDTLVYKLYGLTDEEITVVKGENNL